MQFLSEWGEFLAAFAVFFLSHSIPVRPKVKSRIVAKIGALGFTLLYSALSIAVLTWIISAAGRAPFIEIWAWGTVAKSSAADRHVSGHRDRQHGVWPTESTVIWRLGQ